MSRQRTFDKILGARKQWLKSARLTIDYKDNNVFINEALYKILCKPEKIGLYYDDNYILIITNANIPLSKSLACVSKYEISNSKVLLKNIRLLFDTQDVQTPKRYSVFKLISEYYFTAVLIKMR